MTCHHIPSEPIAAFCFLCKYCGEAIESIPCKKCDGSGVFMESGAIGGEDVCLHCNGTGVDHWEVMK
jgi:DnaJ-class molecular chaperone